MLMKSGKFLGNASEYLGAKRSPKVIGLYTYHLLQNFQLVFPKPFCFKIGKSRKGHLLPSISDPREDEQENANHHHSHHDPKHNQPYGDRWLVRGFQCWLNPQKLQAVVIQAESIIDTAPGLPVPKSKTLRQNRIVRNYFLPMPLLLKGFDKV